MRRDLDKKIWIYTLAIIGIGLVSLYSASYQNVRVPLDIFYDQLRFSIVGILVMYLLGKIDYRKFYDAAYPFYAINLFLLLWVLISGRDALGATRWIQLGPISFQPSEFTKLSLILLLGRYFTHTKPRLSFAFYTKIDTIFRDLLFPLLLTGALMLLIYKQPDLGTSLLMLGIYMVMIYVGGVHWKLVVGLMTALIVATPLLWNFMKSYQKDRLLVFLNPNIDPLGAGYTIIQSKIAIGSGQIFGKGWLAGTQNQLNFLPERHTDFIFSVVGEEWGLVGGLVLMYCYFGLIMNGLHIADQLKDRFGVLVTVGIISIIAMQVVINIGMVIGLCPVVGLTLPLVSYGRSSFLVFIVMMGILLSLSKRRTVF